MAAPLGNQFWKIATDIPEAKLFGGDGSTLWGEAKKYWEWCDTHPWKKVELVRYQGDASEHNIPLGRPYSMDGLTIYLGVSGSYFRSAKAHIKGKIDRKVATEDEYDLLNVIERIETVTRTQQIEGATVGVFNHAIVARVNGLADTINTHNTGDGVVNVIVRDQKTADNLNKLSNAVNGNDQSI